jgi:hypothetical protein
MPSRRSPSQRTQEGRQGRQTAAMTLGSNAGRLISASRRTIPLTSQSAAIVGLLLPFSNTGTLAVTTGTHRLYLEHPGTITSVRAAVGTAPVGASVIVDVKKNGTTIFTTSGHRPTIAASTFTALATGIDVPTVSAGDYLTVDITQIGSTTAGADLTVTVEVLQ